MRIGILGLGRMGAAIAGRLITLGGHDVIVWNRSPAASEPFAAKGAKVAASPADLVTQSDLVISILRDADALEQVFHHPDGVLAGDLKDRLIVEMSTVRPEVQRGLAAAVRERGGAYLEFPVGGSVGPARDGQLMGLAGGRPEDLERARPVLETLCRRIDHIGDIGQAAGMKLVMNLPLLVYYQVLGEALALSGRLGLDPDQVLSIVTDSSGGANVLKRRAPAIAESMRGGDPQPVSVDVDTIRKDLRTMLAESDDFGFDLPLTRSTLGIYDEASGIGWGGRDCTVLPAFWTAKARA
jgi:3-hydroxyisobutyrate dehydrogenase